MKIFLIHFAGGSYYSYNFLLEHLKTFDVVPLELPGRGKRISESLIRDFKFAAKDLYRQMLPLIDNSNFIVYGHSMGAYLALKITHMLTAHGIRPKKLVVSGNIGPYQKDPGKIPRYRMLGDEFVNSLKQLGGVPEGIWGNPEVFQFFEPILRADFEVAERNSPSDFEIINAPITAVMGNEEERVDQIMNWKNYTTEKFKEYVLPGDHFFIYDNAKRLADIISDC
ncbi:MAG: thioesterase [Muricauda sp.]|nr:thioesterase [Allomuricauda sp.]